MSALAHFYSRIEECCRDASFGPVSILTIGDSVTAGAGPEDRIYTDEVYHARLKVMLEQRYPGCAFQVVNVAEGGETATGGLERFDRVVVPHAHDLLIVAYGLNDAATGGTEGIAHYRRAIETYIERSRATSEADILLVTPNMMPLYETDRVPDRWKQLIEPFIEIQKTGVLAAYADCLQQIGVEQGIAVADVYAAWQELAAQGTDTTLMLVNGLNHPDEAGHRLAAQVIMQVIESAGAAA